MIVWVWICGLGFFCGTSVDETGSAAAFSSRDTSCSNFLSSTPIISFTRDRVAFTNKSLISSTSWRSLGNYMNELWALLLFRRLISQYLHFKFIYHLGYNSFWWYCWECRKEYCKIWIVVSHAHDNIKLSPSLSLYIFELLNIDNSLDKIQAPGLHSN